MGCNQIVALVLTARGCCFAEKVHELQDGPFYSPQSFHSVLIGGSKKACDHFRTCEEPGLHCVRNPQHLRNDAHRQRISDRLYQVRFGDLHQRLQDATYNCFNLGTQ